MTDCSYCGNDIADMRFLEKYGGSGIQDYLGARHSVCEARALASRHTHYQHKMWCHKEGCDLYPLESWLPLESPA